MAVWWISEAIPLAVILLSLFVFYYGRIIFDIDVNQIPDWTLDISKPK
jgi:hypothetical protein